MLGAMSGFVALKVNSEQELVVTVNVREVCMAASVSKDPRAILVDFERPSQLNVISHD